MTSGVARIYYYYYYYYFKKNSFGMSGDISGNKELPTQ